MPHRKRYLFVCTNRRDASNPKGSCAQKGSEDLVKQLKESLVKRGLAAEIRACAVGCLDLCEIGAAIVQEPEHVAYGHVTPGDVDAIVAAAAEGRVVERLVVYPRRDDKDSDPERGA
jgi:(2Fe-2S) ferredoxin